MTASTSIIRHVLSALQRAIGRVLLWFLIGFVVAAAIVEGVSFAAGNFAASSGHSALIGHIAAAVAGLILGYAAGLTVLIVEVVRFFVTTLQDLERDVRGELSGGTRIVEGIVENIEKRL